MEILEKLKEKVNLEEQNFLLKNESSKVEMDNGKLKAVMKNIGISDMFRFFAFKLHNVLLQRHFSPRFEQSSFSTFSFYISIISHFCWIVKKLNFKNLKIFSSWQNDNIMI